MLAEFSLQLLRLRFQGRRPVVWGAHSQGEVWLQALSTTSLVWLRQLNLKVAAMTATKPTQRRRRELKPFRAWGLRLRMVRTILLPIRSVSCFLLVYITYCAHVEVSHDWISICKCNAGDVDSGRREPCWTRKANPADLRHGMASIDKSGTANKCDPAHWWIWLREGGGGRSDMWFPNPKRGAHHRPRRGRYWSCGSHSGAQAAASRLQSEGMCVHVDSCLHIRVLWQWWDEDWRLGFQFPVF